MTRICLDSNVIIAAFAARGLCADLLRTVLADFHLVLPQVVIDEVRQVVADKLKLSSEAVAAVESVFDLCDVIPKGTSPSPVKIRDPDDERVLADALAGEAHVLVTGDDDLLSVAGEAPIPILSPRGFMTLISRGGAL